MRSSLSSHIPVILALVGSSGCAGSIAGDSIALGAPALPPSDGLLASPALHEVVDLQVARDGTGLLGLLESPDAPIRARTALALASVQDPAALDALTRLLGDASTNVRRNAAFALGQLSLPDGGIELLTALAEESVAGPRWKPTSSAGSLNVGQEPRSRQVPADCCVRRQAGGSGL